MDVSASLEAACSVDVLFDEVADLGGYPDWLSIVSSAVPVSDVEAGGAPPSWDVELRGRIGRLARSKRLRMARTVHEPPERVRFERREVGGRGRGSWVLDAVVEPTDPGSRLTMLLQYRGPFDVGALERMVDEEIAAGRPRLAEKLARRTDA